MTHEIRLLSLIDVLVESSFLVLARNMGTPVRVHTWGILILGNPAGPILVDTGASSPEIMQRLGMTGWVDEEQQLENALAAHGISIGDVAALLHSHCHIDHAGQDNRFPMTTPVVMNRRELEHSASGLMGAQYPPEYVKHHIDRLHTPGALRLLDLELSGPDEIYDGIVCESAGGHTEGSMNILVETAEGTACICGDVIYDIQNQVVEPWHQVLAYEPQTTGNPHPDEAAGKGCDQEGAQRRLRPAAARLSGSGGGWSGGCPLERCGSGSRVACRRVCGDQRRTGCRGLTRTESIRTPKEGTNIVRGELGAAQTEVRAAEPRFQMDIPAREAEAVGA